MNSPAPVLSGLLVVDKPVGVSSMDVVRKVRRVAGGRKTKVGHAGTLDPLASGVVVCCLGKATRLVEKLMDLPKVYETRIDLSAFTETDDREGTRQEVKVADKPDQETVRRQIRQFVGLIEQRPPPYSAVHVGGKRAYQMARKGELIELPARTVRIDQVMLLEYEWPILALRITCGRGTYIRSIARDLGRALDTGGHLAALRRTAVGPYDLSTAFTWQRLDAPIGADDLIDSIGP